MKKILSVLLVLILTLGLVAPTFAADNPATGDNGTTEANENVQTLETPTPFATPLGYSVQGTTLAAGTPSSDVGSDIRVNSTFSVSFDRNSFIWSQTGDGTYNIGKLVAAWVRLENATLGQDFSIEGVSVNETNGTATITFKALRVFDNTIKVYLDSSGSAANAATNSFQKSIKVTEPPTGTSTIIRTKSGGTAPYSTSHTGTVEINTGDQIHYVVPSDNFEWTDGAAKDASTLTNTSWIRLRGAVVGRDFEATITTAPNTSDVTITLTALRAATFSSFNLSMQGGSGQATAASPDLIIKINDIGEGSIIDGIASSSELGGNNSGALLNGVAISYSALSALDIKQGDEILIPLTAGFFTWDGNAPFAGSPVTTAQLRRGNITVGVANRRGGNILESGSPSLVSRNNAAFVRLKFKDSITTTSEIDFSCTIFLAIRRSRHNDSRVEIEGVFSPDIFHVNNSDTFFDISDGSIVEAEEFVRNVELYLGNGVSVHTNLYQGKRYAGIAVDDISPIDEENLNRFPSIDRILTIKSSTLNRPNTKVTIDTQGINYYVYGAEGEYLGRSNGTLAYSHKYYLSTKQIDMDIQIDTDVNGEITVPDGDYIYDPIDGDKTPDNWNNNPGTGR